MAVRKQHKKFTSPRKLFDKARIDEENILLKNYGLKNKTEIWKADFSVNKVRSQAKDLITVSAEKQKEFLERLMAKGLVKKGAQIDDVLALTKEAILERRLQTVVFKKGIAKTAKAARQLITHRHVMVDGEIVTVPSYFVNLDNEHKISLVIKVKKPEKSEGDKNE